jgi:hypothetical protein
MFHLASLVNFGAANAVPPMKEECNDAIERLGAFVRTGGYSHAASLPGGV